MVFACQADSFLREYKSVVLSCKDAEIERVVKGKKEKTKCYEVVMENTILFPEGGGQPCDHGTVDGIPVLQVNRRGAEAIHFLLSPVPEGKTVKQIVDWERRLDHMQQHSGQHLITALADSEFKYPTTSWWLGEETSFIELDTASIKPGELEHLEELVNNEIRNSVTVTVAVIDDYDPVMDVRTRGLPKDHVGPIRIITIEGIESNVCCGTHVTNLSQLQAIKLLFAEKGKKGKTNLHFVVGNRVLKCLSNCLNREQKMSALVKGGPASHADLVEKLQKSLKISNKNLQSALKDIAVVEAIKLKQQIPKPKYFSMHRKDAEPDFMSFFVKEVQDESVLLFLTVGEDRGSGSVLLNGESSIVSILGPQICEVLEGKGAGKGSRFNAKVNNLGNRKKAEKIIEEFFQSN